MQATFVDFRAVKQAVNMKAVLDHYQVTWLRKRGEEVRGRCPIHKGEGTDTFHAHVGKNAFQCFSCKARGNVLDFVAAMERCSVRDAAVKLAEWFSVAVDNGTSRSPAPEKPTVEAVPGRGEGSAKNEPLKFQLKDVKPDHPYLAARGIRKETALEFGLGYFAGKGSMSGRVVIPIHNERGELVAYAGRAIDNSEPKYKLPAGFQKHLELYNLHRAIAGENTGSGRTVVVVEGFFGAAAVHEADYRCVALMGSSLSAEQDDLLCRHFTGVALMFDGDEAGRKATDECLLRLGRRGLWVKAVLLEEGRQPDTLRQDELQSALDNKVIRVV